MYHAIVARMVRRAENVHHAFAGDHPLGGERHSRIHIRWGRAVYVHAYENSQAVEDACRHMAANGVAEAAAAPVTD
jgi:hypothetical protein